MQFRNPLNNHVETSTGALSWLWCLLFGIIYFAARGNWKHVLLGFIFAGCTAGISWLIYPFFVRGINNALYLRSGWIPVTADAQQGISVQVVNNTTNQ